MHVLYYKILLTAVCMWLVACSKISENATIHSAKVVVKKSGKTFQLIKDGQPYYIQGAGGYDFLPELKAAGGNSIRTWDTNNAKKILDEAHQLGLTVTLGLRVLREKEGFDYSDQQAVSAQFENIKKDILLYKDHPALLMWCIGNEIYASAKTNKAWDFVNDVAKFIHQVDPNHPTATAIINTPAAILKKISSDCPALDLVFINTYGGIPRVYNEIRESYWKGAYIISEYGSQGYWEAPRTSWDVVIEETSNKKAEMYKSRYESFIRRDEERCLGSYAFFWGQKQERTSTWFNIFTEKGEKTAIADALQQVWTGAKPVNQAPFINYIHIGNKLAEDNIYLIADSTYTAKVIGYDPDNDPLTFAWELLEDKTDLKDGIFNQDKQQVVTVATHPQTGLSSNTFLFNAPKKEGPYRLLVYVSDGKKSASTANIPFYVIP